MQHLYIEENSTPVVCEDVLEWGRWMQGPQRLVGRTLLSQGFVSSVFLGVNHQWRVCGRPILYETMIFDNPLFSDHMRRYDSRWACHSGHVRIAAAAELIIRLHRKRASWRRIKQVAKQADMQWWVDKSAVCRRR